MDYKLKLFILACAITGSLSILCEHCADNFVENAGFPNCSAPQIRNCSVYDNQNCIQGNPNYDNCTRDTILGCFNGSIVYTDGNGTQQTGLFRSCSFSSSVDVCSQESCNETTASAFNQTSSTPISCAADCCFNDRCNHGQVAAAPSMTSVPTTDGTTQVVPDATTTTHVAPSSTVQVSCFDFMGLLCLGVFVLL